jgi:hypothetical protein
MIGEATTPRESHQPARPRAAFDQAVSYPQEFKKFLHLAGLKMSARFLRASVMSGARRMVAMRRGRRSPPEGGGEIARHFAALHPPRRAGDARFTRRES